MRRLSVAASARGSAGSAWTASRLDGCRPPAWCIPFPTRALAFVPEAGAQCVSNARWDLCGGPPARAVPTAIRPVPTLPPQQDRRVATGSAASGWDRKALSTVAGQAGGPARSSDETPVMRVEPRGRVARGGVRSINRTRVVWEESCGRAEVVRQAVCDFEVGSLGGVGEGQGEQGCTRGGWVLDRGLRGRSEEQPVSDLEPDVVGELLPTCGAGGGDTEVAWRWGPDFRGAHRRRQSRPNGGSPQAGGEGRADLPSRLLRLPATPVGPGRGGGMPAALLANRLGARPRHPEVLRQRAMEPHRQGGGGTHRPAVGRAVCQAVAPSTAAAARRHPATPRPWNPAGVGGLTRAGEPVLALCVRRLDGQGAPDCQVRTL